MKKLRVVAGLVSVVVVGCAAPNKAAQVKNAFSNRTVDGEPWFGEIDGDLRPVAGREMAWTQGFNQTMSYKGLVDGRLCFVVTESPQYFGGSVVKELEEWEVAVRKRPYVFEAHDSLEALERTGAWPDPALNHVKDVRVVDFEVTKSKCHVSSVTGKCEYTETLEVKLELCGQAPPIGPATQLLTVTRHRDDGFQAYVWKVAPNPGRAAAPAARSAQPADEPAVSEPPSDPPSTVTEPE